MAHIIVISIILAVMTIGLILIAYLFTKSGQKFGRQILYMLALCIVIAIILSCFLCYRLM